MADATGKSEQAFRTIGELASELDVPQHILRYWESRFPQLKPLQRAGNRRYYRPADVALARRIHALLNRDGYTIRGVQQLLASGDPEADSPEASAPEPGPERESRQGAVSLDQLKALRRLLAEALDA
ncbi:MAG TPA: MerR family transcriptional regulator [Allosphingosinicella sp.]|jgi:DNA-binding transcriptional MerR regulator